MQEVCHSTAKPFFRKADYLQKVCSDYLQRGRGLSQRRQVAKSGARCERSEHRGSVSQFVAHNVTHGVPQRV